MVRTSGTDGWPPVLGEDEERQRTMIKPRKTRRFQPIAGVLVTALLTAFWLAAAPAEAATFDVTAYGAAGDGTTDDYAAIQAAIDAAESAGGGVVLFPPPSSAYLLSDTLDVRHSDIELSGYGATVKLADGATSHGYGSATDNQVHVIYVTGTVSQRVQNVLIKGLTIDANIYNQTDYYNPRAVVFEHSQQALVQDVTIKQAFVGLDFGYNCDDCEARNVTMENYSEDGFDASGDANVHSAGVSSNIRFINCHAINAPSAEGNAWEIEDGAQHILVQDCTVGNVGGSGFGIRNHWGSHTAVTTDIELRRVQISNTAGRYGIYANCPPQDIYPNNRVSDVRLIDVECEGQVLAYGPMEGFRADGGQYGNRIYLGWQSPMADAMIENTVAGRIDINGVGVDNVTVRNTTVNAGSTGGYVGMKVYGGSDAVQLTDCHVQGAEHPLILCDGASPLIQNLTVSVAYDQFDAYPEAEAWTGGGDWTTESDSDYLHKIGPAYASGEFGTKGTRVLGSISSEARLFWNRTFDDTHNIVRFHMRPDQIDESLAVSIKEGSEGSGSHLVLMYFAEDGTIRAYRGSALADLGAYSADVWYDVWIQLDFAGNQFRVKIDGSSWSVWGNFYENASAAGAGSLGFYTGYGTVRAWDIDRIEVEGGDFAIGSCSGVADQFDEHPLTGGNGWPGMAPEWTTDGYLGCQWIQDNVVSGLYGTKALQMYNWGSTVGRIFWNQTITAATPFLNMYNRRDNNNQNFGVFLKSQGDGGGNYVVSMLYADNGYLKVHNGTDYFNYAPYAANEWHWLKVQLDFPANQFRVKLGDHAWSDWHDFMEGAFDQVGSVYFYTYDGASRILYVDRIEIVSSAPGTCQEVTTAGYSLATDFDGDCYINWGDFSILAADWLQCVDPQDPQCRRPWEQ